MGEPSWKSLELTLERPYKDDNGERIPVLLDITTEGQHIYESENTAQKLGENLRRIFIERGFDFFETGSGPLTGKEGLPEEIHVKADSDDDIEVENDVTNKFMTIEELYKMRMEILPQLFISLGEMSHARDLVTSLLQSPQTSTPSSLSATIVSKPPPIVSVQAFNSQLTIGSKDEALRKAADVFKSAAESMERGRIKGEKYWVDALKVRRGNWRLMPAPLPHGAATGKGADKTSKDFLICYGLEESPAVFRRQAVGHMSTYDDISDDLLFPQRQYTRLRVSVTAIDATGKHFSAYNIVKRMDTTTLDGILKAAQQEVVEQEIFSLLVQEAGSLPTASARVAERLIVIDAAQGMELKFELLDAEAFLADPSDNRRNEICDLIYTSLHALLLRRHWHLKLRRLGHVGVINTPGSTEAPLILRPIIDLLQYRVFCERIKLEIDKMVQALSVVGVPSTLRFDPVGEAGQQLVQFFDEDDHKIIGGEIILKIDSRHMVRLTFLSPSSLTAHLSQATLTISSIPQLHQLLTDEIERCLLQRISELGTELCDHVGGTWFVDLNRCVGRWEGCVLNFRVSFGNDLSINCSAFRLDRTTHKQGQLDNYAPTHNAHVPLLLWVEQVIKSAF